MRLLPGWYVAARSEEIAQRPVSIALFDRSLVARRDERGTPVLTDGEPRLSTVERYGYVWAWYGTPAPEHPLPSFPLADDADRPSFRLSMSTTAGVQRILESQYDADHYVTVHKVRARSVSVTGSPAERLLDPREAMFSARIDAPLVPPAGVVTRVLGAFGTRLPRTFSTTADSFSTGSVSVTRLGDISLWALLGVAPVAPKKTIIHELVLLEKTGSPLRDALGRLVWKALIQASNRQDLAVLNRSDDALGDPYEGDETILDFRRAYGRAAAAPPAT